MRASLSVILASILLGTAPLFAQGNAALLNVHGTTVLVEVPVGEKALMKGLMYRTSLNENQGMLFVFPSPGIYPFWMKNTLIPLSVAFLDKEGRVINIEKMSPLTETLHYPLAPEKLALEMNQGWFDAHGVRPGERIACSDGNGFKCVPHYR